MMGYTSMFNLTMHSVWHLLLDKRSRLLDSVNKIQDSETLETWHKFVKKLI